MEKIKTSGKTDKETLRQTDLGKRTWNDFRNIECTKGAFSSTEIETLKKSLCKFATDNNLTEDALKDLIVNSLKSKTAGIWSKIAEDFPNRTVQSIQNICKRRFNPHNYKGKWSEEEIKRMIALVKKEGRKWVQIGQILERTPTNVRDKWREIGEENFSKRKHETVWDISDSLKMIAIIEQTAGIKLLDNASHSEIIKEYENEKNTLDPENTGLKNKEVNGLLRTVICGHFNKAGLKKILKMKVNWTTVSKKLRTKSKDDCKNHWNVQILKDHKKKVKKDYKAMLALIAKLKSLKVKEESQIDWTALDPELKNVWESLKRHLPMSKSFGQYLAQCEKYLNRKSAKKYEKYQTEEYKNELLSLYRQKSAPHVFRKFLIKD